MPDYSIANRKIFYDFLISNRLPTPSDIHNYLSYSEHWGDQPFSLIIPHDSTGWEVFRKYNSHKGCVQTDCNFSHVWDHWVDTNKACNKQHLVATNFWLYCHDLNRIPD